MRHYRVELLDAMSVDVYSACLGVAAICKVVTGYVCLGLQKVIVEQSVFLCLGSNRSECLSQNGSVHHVMCVSVRVVMCS
jgi:hypothetical protein